MTRKSSVLARAGGSGERGQKHVPLRCNITKMGPYESSASFTYLNGHLLSILGVDREFDLSKGPLSYSTPYLILSHRFYHAFGVRGEL